VSAAQPIHLNIGGGKRRHNIQRGADGNMAVIETEDAE
jgi:hypothetical protein